MEGLATEVAAFPAAGAGVGLVTGMATDPIDESMGGKSSAEIVPNARASRLYRGLGAGYKPVRVAARVWGLLSITNRFFGA
jgi:hypothetical protein